MKRNFEIINIGSGKSYSINEIIKTIQKIYGKNIFLKNKNINRKNEILHTKLDINKAIKTLKWKPRWSLKRGLEYIVKKNEMKKNSKTI